MTSASDETTQRAARRRPTRSLDSLNCVQIKRSHEANQERAYVAASRRADRSLEARVQSARAASEIHKRRTGKGFKITEEIVLKEEMYEEEEDETPRPFRLLAAHLQTKSPYFNQRINAFLTNRVAMATLNHQREVERMFAQQFPNAQQVSQRLHQSIYYQSMQLRDPRDQQSDHTSPGTPIPPTYPVQAAPGDFGDRPSSEARVSLPPPPTEDPARPARHSSLDDLYPAPGTPNAADPAIASRRTSQLPHAHDNISPAAFLGPGYSPLVAESPSASHLMQQPKSSFTSDLSSDASMLANIDMSDPMARVLLAGDFGYLGQGMGAQPASSMMQISPSRASYLSIPSAG